MPRLNGNPGKLPSKAAIEPKDKLLVSREEAAQLLSISPRAIDYLIANQQLTIRRIGTRVLIPTADVQRFARADHPEPLAC